MQFNWSFPQFIVNPQEGQLQNVVVGINWVCTGNDGNVSSSASGTVKLGNPNPAQFIPYAEITEQIAYNWVSQRISITGVESQISSQIIKISQPSTQPQNPPF